MHSIRVDDDTYRLLKRVKKRMMQRYGKDYRISLGWAVYLALLEYEVKMKNSDA